MQSIQHRDHHGKCLINISLVSPLFYVLDVLPEKHQAHPSPISYLCRPSYSQTPLFSPKLASMFYLINKVPLLTMTRSLAAAQCALGHQAPARHRGPGLTLMRASPKSSCPERRCLGDGWLWAPRCSMPPGQSISSRGARRQPRR